MVLLNYKQCQGHKVRGKLRSSARVKASKETRQLSDAGCGPSAEKDITGTAGQRMHRTSLHWPRNICMFEMISKEKNT